MDYKELVKRFLDIYGGTEEGIRIFEAPGRINLIGEHLDYNGGHVFPVAVDMTNTVIARPNSSDTINLAVTSLPDRVNADIDRLEQYKYLSWGNYQLGVAYFMRQAGYNVVGCDLLYHGNVPYGAGLSSSASIEVAMALTLAKLGGQLSPDMVELALLSQKAENQYVGMNCGIMDQFAAAMSKKDHALFLDCAALTYRYVHFDLRNYTIVITNTNAPHKLTESQYNMRRLECEQALAIINANGGSFLNLCAITMDELECYKKYFNNEVIYKRARHCVTEEARTVMALEALERGDIAAFGRLLCEAHISMRDYYQATGIELDTVFEIAVGLEGVIGSRMTGGGFGGCNISLVERDKVEEFKQSMADAYVKRIGYAPSFYQSGVAKGAREVTL